MVADISQVSPFMRTRPGLPTNCRPSTIRGKGRGKVPWPVSSANWRRSSLQTLSATLAWWGATRDWRSSRCLPALYEW